ncbi:DinB family protein [Thermogemmatispora carboxidivorans]|uniref:DinB family protein n=1 Tax=Thermogemmatispora carboxidivorans TaxID=1382306 RepID=UPI00069C09E1|nr:DinB family protein [Thermogemmatispora carboxidivorans]
MEAMTNEARQFSSEFDRIAHEVLQLLQQVPAALLDHPFPTPESYSIFMLATYLVEVGEFWIVGQIGKKPYSSTSLAEFCAAGTLPALVSRYQRWLKEVHDILDSLSDEALDEPLAFALAPGGLAHMASMTARACLQQAIRHCGLILEHMRTLSRSLLSSAEGGAPVNIPGISATAEERQNQDGQT